MGKSSSTPETPDYLGAALAQGQLSKESALSQTGLNRPNEVTPWGSRTWSYTPQNTGGSNAGSGGTGNPNANPTIPYAGGTTEDPFGGRVMSATGGGGGSSSVAQTAKTTDPTIKIFGNEYRQMPDGGMTAVSPSGSNGMVAKAIQGATGQSDYASLLDASNASIINPGDWTSTTTLSPDQQEIFDQSNAYKKLSGGLASSTLQDFASKGAINFNDPGFGATNLQAKQLERFNAPGISQDALNYSPDQFSSERSRVEDTLYNRQLKMLEPGYQQQEAAMRSRLANQGLMEGSEAYKTEMDNFIRNRDQAYQGARDSAILAGGQEQSRLNSDMLASRSNDLQSQMAGYNSELQKNQTNNQLSKDEFSQDAQSQQTNFNSNLGLMQSLLQARGQAFNEAQGLNAGTSIQMPQFGNCGLAGGSQTPDITGAIGNTYNANLGAANAENAANNQQSATAASLLGMMLMMSDRRLKSNIRKVGTGHKGLNVYEYDIFGKHETGYMAQEVQDVGPEAVSERPDGYVMVSYALLGGRP